MTIKARRYDPSGKQGQDRDLRARIEREDLRNVKKGYQLATEDGQQVIYSGNGDKHWFADPSSATVSVILPAAADSVGTLYTATRIAVGNSLLVSSTSGNINGVATLTCSAAVGDFIRVRSNGTGYFSA